MSDSEMARPNPDALLAAITKEEKKSRRGLLKIFFGMSAGVGKTYAMLKAAQKAKSEGIDVAAGVVVTHNRAETAELLKGLEVIPPKQIDYKEKQLEEMDLDGILKRKPKIVLVDELAHTNVPGSRHPKRYQDVLELLEKGINVYTTVNVQHLESRADTVAQITGIKVFETVPDSIIEAADEIELIDIPPDELLKRLAEGKVYTPDKSAKAVENFFRKGNLTALREMALRLTAERVDQQLRDYMEVKRISGPWKSGERLLVAVGPSPFSEKLIRWTRRMAYTMEAPWVAVHVETHHQLNDADKERLGKNVALAKELGAEMVSTVDEDISNALIRVAREKNATQIVVGKPMESLFLGFLKGKTLVDRLIHESGDIDIYVVRAEKAGIATKQPLFKNKAVLPDRSEIQQYFKALGIIAVVGVLCFMGSSFIGYQSVSIILLFVVSLLPLWVGRGPVLVAAGVSALMWNFFFIPPLYTFHVAKLEDQLTFGMYFIIALVTGSLTAKVRAKERALQFREERAVALYSISKDLSSSVTETDVLKAAVENIEKYFNAKTSLILASNADSLEKAPQNGSLILDEKEKSVASWTFSNQKKAGKYTSTLPSASNQYFPIMAPRGISGIMGIRRNDDKRFSPDEENLLETFLQQIGSALERENLSESASKALLLTQSEHLYKTLLNSISHELRTPIAAIISASSGLKDPQTSANPEARTVMTDEIEIAATRLNRLVENLLDMTRLESGMMKITTDWCDIGDVINTAVQQLKNELAQHHVYITIEPEFPLLKLDFVLIEQAITNILHNAATYTPAGTNIYVKVFKKEQTCLIIIENDGPDISQDAIETIFDKFFRAPGSKAGGTGLGLSITKGLIEAHGGRITAENRSEGGAQFIIQLPITSQ